MPHTTYWWQIEMKDGFLIIRSSGSVSGKVKVDMEKIKPREGMDLMESGMRRMAWRVDKKLRKGYKTYSSRGFRV